MSDTTSVRQTGQVKFYDSRKGFGFIKPDDGSRDVFIGINNLPKGVDSLLTDQRCAFNVKLGKPVNGDPDRPAVDGKLELR